MKNVLIALILAFTSSLVSAQLALDIYPDTDGTRTINHKQDEWSFVVKAASYSVFVDKSIIGKKQKQVEFHAITEFNELQQYSELPFEIKRIYSYGVLSCEEGKLYLLADLFTDQDNTIRYTQSHTYGSYVTNLGEHTVSRSVYDAVCGDTI